MMGLIGFGLAFSAALVGAARAGIEGTKHDFTNREWAGGNACNVCHGSESEPPTAAPLWNPKADLNRVLGKTLIQSKNAGLGTVVCIRCHDGTIARATLAPQNRVRFVNKENPGLYGASHGRRDHPVGVNYPSFDKGFRAPVFVKNKGVSLPGGKVECISCHDPHGFSGERFMLVTSNAGSALCLTCHRK